MTRNQPAHFGNVSHISSSAIHYSRETVLVISDLFACVALNTSNVGGNSVQIINLPPTTINNAPSTVIQFAEKNAHIRNFVSKILVRLGTFEVLGPQELSSLWPLFPPFIKILQGLYPAAGIFLCSVLPVEDAYGSALTPQRVTVLNSWLYSMCNSDHKIYYLNFYVMFINEYGKNYGMFKDAVSLNECGERMLLQYYHQVVQNEILMIV